MIIEFDKDIWTSELMQELTPQEKYFYMYLITNDHLPDAYSSCDGLSLTYKITKGQMSKELGYERRTVNALLKSMERKSIAFYNEDTLEVEIFPFKKGGM